MEAFCMMNLSLDNLSIGYGTRTVASGIKATVKAGQLTCLIGENGVGKSTLLRTIAAFQPKLGGSISIDGKDISLYNGKELARLISVVLTNRPDTANLTAKETVELGRTPYTGFWGRLTGADRDIVEHSIRQAGVTSLADRRISTLSDGERQKVMIAKALAQQTPVIILDEPTAFLDYPSKVEIMLMLMRLSHVEGKTVFMSTHDIELAMQTADTLWLMTRNGGLATGTPRELADRGMLSSFIERPGIRFERSTMKIVVEKPC